MKNKTKKIIKITIAVLLIVALQIMGITYAKYISQDTATGQAEIAKWAFKIEKSGEEKKTIKLADTATPGTLENGRIIPGSKGKFEIVLDGTGSEVDIEYDVKFTNEINKPTNLKFTYFGSKYESLSQISLMKGTIQHDANIPKQTIEVEWEWPYETGMTTIEKNENNQIDTQDANVSGEYTFDIIATGTQKSK